MLLDSQSLVTGLLVNISDLATRSPQLGALLDDRRIRLESF
jgi:hypothetical protein